MKSEQVNRTDHHRQLGWKWRGRHCICFVFPCALCATPSWISCLLRQQRRVWPCRAPQFFRSCTGNFLTCFVSSFSIGSNSFAPFILCGCGIVDDRSRTWCAPLSCHGFPRVAVDGHSHLPLPRWCSVFVCATSISIITPLGACMFVYSSTSVCATFLCSLSLSLQRVSHVHILDAHFFFMWIETRCSNPGFQGSEVNGKHAEQRETFPELKNLKHFRK